MEQWHKGRCYPVPKPFPFQEAVFALLAMFAEILAQLPEPKARQAITRPAHAQQSCTCAPNPLARLRGEEEVSADAVCGPPHPELLEGAPEAEARGGRQHPGSLAGAPRSAAVQSQQAWGAVFASSMQRIFSTTKVMLVFE